MSPTVRQLGADEAGLRRDARLRALRDVPMAFGSTLAREQASTQQEWARWATLA